MGTPSLPSGRASVPAGGVDVPDEFSRLCEIFVGRPPGAVAPPGGSVDVSGGTVDGIDDGATILDETSCVADDEDGFQEKQRVDRRLEAMFSKEVVVDPRRASMVRTPRSMWPSPEGVWHHKGPNRTYSNSSPESPLPPSAPSPPRHSIVCALSHNGLSFATISESGTQGRPRT